MEKWLLNRLFDIKDQPNPKFAFDSSVYWMRALAIIANSDIFSDNSLKKHYENVGKRTINQKADTYVYENILMALHNLASIQQINKDIKNKYNVVRSAIIAWYYMIYCSCRAMVFAASGSCNDTHTSVQKVWQSQIVENNNAIGPYGIYFDTLVKKDTDAKIAEYRNGNTFYLSKVPTSEFQAWGAIYAYLNGTADYEKWRVEEQKIRKSSDYKELKVSNFRTKVAQEIRDRYLCKEHVNFLTQTFRYRGKANYRDSIFLSYGENRIKYINQLTIDLEMVASKFLKMACFYIKKRVEKNSYYEFVSDMKNNLKISIDFDFPC